MEGYAKQTKNSDGFVVGRADDAGMFRAPELRAVEDAGSGRALVFF